MAEAGEALNRALARARESRLTDYEAELLVEIGILDAKANDRAAAIAHLNEAAELATRGNVYRIEASAALELVKLYRQSREYGQAHDWALRGLVAIRKLDDKFDLPSHLAAMAAVEADAGRVREANALYEEATDVVEGLLVNAPSLSAKSSFVCAMSEVYLGHFKLAAEQMHSVPAAFRILERARGRVATDALRARSMPEPEATREPSIVEQEIATLQVALMRTDAERQRKRLLEDLFAAEQRLGAAQAGQRPGAVQVRERPVSLNVVRGALRHDEMLLEYVLAEPASYCLAITRDSADLVRLSGQKQIESEIALHLKEVRSKQAAKETGRRLFGLLIEPVRGLPRKTRLVIVPDGALHSLSFDSLVDGAGRYVVESHVVSYAPSGTTLDLLRANPSRLGAGAEGLVIGGVSYDREKKLLARVGIDGKQEATRGLSELKLSALSPISHAEDEVKAVAASGGKWTVLEGESATESRFKAQPLERYRILHFATHGISDAKYPDRAALILGWDPATADDGLLQAREISRLNLNAELVVLSACDTGEGRLEGEAGVANLVRAFMIAGARSVVVSQWAADDTSTLALMTGFYRNLAGGYDRAAALRRAKQDFLARFGANAVPYYWAGFVLVGESATRVSLQN
jgi:CHAT domain-containing protein